MLMLLLLAQISSAQTPDSAQILLRTLPGVSIREVRFERTGYRVWKADSLPGGAVGTLSERLLWENNLDVRANAPGTLATLSVRGAGPNRTPVFWNGLNLQSPMNGVMDAALVTIWPGDQLEIHYGGQSAAQSSGAMGGSVLLEQGGQSFNEGYSGFLSGEAGRFGRLAGSAGLGYSGKKLVSMIRVATLQAENNFTFSQKGLDGKFYPVQQVNNFVSKTDLQQFNQLKINDKNSLKTSFWFQNAFREIPPATTEVPRETWQRDRAHRALAIWENAPNTRVLWTTRAAWLDDFLAFHLAGDTDSSRSKQIILSTERSVKRNKNFAWRSGFSTIQQWAKVDGYADTTQWFGQTRLSGFGMGEWQTKNARFSALIRQEWVQEQAAPFTGTLSGQLGLGRVGEAKFHISRNFNLPTFNDRFWKNLGRLDLRPEKGHSADLSWIWSQPRYLIEITGFHLILDDWILWQPDATGLFRPDNLRKVWSRGVELSGKWKLLETDATSGPDAGSKWNVTLGARVQFSKTTHVAVYGGSESVLGKQLAYTPRASGGLSLQLSRGMFSAAYLQQFTGTRFDNNGSPVEDFQVGNLLASCTLFQQRFTLSFRLENIWNTQYEIIRYRPMPGRSWSLGMLYRLGR